jgi:SAM-dependent methyltransferase
MGFEKYYNGREYTRVGGFRRKAVLAAIDRQNPSILDIGCSDGELGALIKEAKGGSVFGIDISRSSIARAKERLDQAFVLDIESDPETWPAELKSKTFDYVIISEVLEHLLEPEKLLRAARVFMDKDSELIVTIPNLLFWKNRLKIMLGRFEYEEKGLMDHGHIHIFTWKTIQAALAGTGFELIDRCFHLPTRGTRKIGNLLPGLFAFQFLIKARKKRKVIYTAIFGGKDELIDPERVMPDYDYICFSDQDHSSKVWQVIKQPPTHADPVRSAKIYKILPHRYLADYDVSIWIDGNKYVRGDVDELVDAYLAKNSMAVFNHAELSADPRDCLYEEAAELLRLDEAGKIKDNPDLIKKQVSRYREEGYPEKNGLISGMVLIRKHNDPLLRETMEAWWKEIEQGSRRDQLSFNYVAWKKKFSFSFIPGDSRNNKYFGHRPHKKRHNVLH